MSFTKPELKVSWETRSCIVRSPNGNYLQCGVFHTWELGKEKVTAIVELWNGVSRVDPENIIFTDDTNQWLYNMHKVAKKNPEELKKYFSEYFSD